MKKPENVILIIVDCLRADCAYDRKLMPFVNKTFKYKKEAYTNAPSTHFAMPAILTGKVPFEVTDEEGINEQNIDFYLPKIMKEKGYKTIFITGNVVTSGYFGYNQYWDYMEDFLGSGKLSRKKLSDFLRAIAPKFIVENAFFKNFLGKHVKKFTNQQNLEVELKVNGGEIVKKLNGIQLAGNNFICLHLMETHAPYSPKREFDKKIVKKIRAVTSKLYLDEGSLDDEDKKFLKEMYIEEAKDADSCIEEIFDILGSRIDLKNSLVIITADHGEAFNEKGYFKHPSERVGNFHHIRIPFFSNRDAGGKIVWSTGIYSIIRGSVEKFGSCQKEFCIGHKKSKNRKHFPVSFFDHRTKKMFEGEGKLKKGETPGSIQKAIFHGNKNIDDAISMVRIEGI